MQNHHSQELECFWLTMPYLLVLEYLPVLMLGVTRSVERYER